MCVQDRWLVLTPFLGFGDQWQKGTRQKLPMHADRLLLAASGWHPSTRVATAPRSPAAPSTRWRPDRLALLRRRRRAPAVGWKAAQPSAAYGSLASYPPRPPPPGRRTPAQGIKRQTRLRRAPQQNASAEGNRPGTTRWTPR